MFTTNATNPGIERAIKLAGGRTRLARLLQVTAQNVDYWLRRNCPGKRAIEIERLLGVPRDEIRPDLFK